MSPPELQPLKDQPCVRITWRLAEKIFHNWRRKEESSRQGEGVEMLYSQDPLLQKSCPKRSPRNIWLWKPVGLVLRRASGLQATETLILEGVHKIVHAPSPSAEALIWITSVTLTCWSWRASWKGRRQWGLSLGMETREAAVTGSMFYCKTADAAGCHFGVPS